MTKNDYITIPFSMIEELELKGNELIIYAIISSFSRDGTSDFHGSLKYLQKWTRSSNRGVLNSLESLLSKGLIIKEKVGKFCHYRAVIETPQERSVDDFPSDFPEEPKEPKKKTSFSKSDYQECIKLINENRQKLRDRHLKIDETEYTIPTLNSWLKKKFTEYGIENTKKGIINSVNNEWLVKNAGYSLTALFSDKIFPKFMNETTFKPQMKSNIKHSKIDYSNQDYSEVF